MMEFYVNRILAREVLEFCIRQFRDQLHLFVQFLPKSILNVSFNYFSSYFQYVIIIFY
ncbi:unnamed protein product [Moneuplotes crassus]|uniref:Uncharacterized protein n=1 Tax=Euplotes crassus TaxID=5936 RepID=A0AAD1U004_EUPCR|nr:unnamed protein product [Moneuplotes crassus]